MHTTKGLSTCNKNVTSFELITKWLDVGYTLNLSSNALTVMTHLLRCYNPDNKFVFPHQSRIAERANISVKSVQRAIAELIQAQLLIKMKTTTGNIYGFTNKLFDLCQVSDRPHPSDRQSHACKQKQIKEKIIHHKNMTLNVRLSDDDFKFNLIKPGSRQEKIKIENVPSIIKNNKNIKNPCGYWASLTQEERNFQLKKQEEEETAKILKIENARKLKELREIEEAERKEAEQAPRPNEFNFEQAFRHLKQIASLSFAHKALQSPMCRELMRKHNITIDMLYCKTKSK